MGMRALSGAFSVNFQNELFLLGLLSWWEISLELRGISLALQSRNLPSMKASLEEAEQRNGELQIPDFDYRSQRISSLAEANFQWISAICNRNYPGS